MTTFVLVHGAWHGGWCWRRVADKLIAKGHSVFTPTLTGVGERSHLRTRDTDLTTQITDVVNVMRWEDLTDVVLCGHSYGGFVVSGVAEQIESAISSIVYLDAFLPEDGDCLADNWEPERRKTLYEQAESGIPTEPFPAEFFAVNAHDRAWVDSKCVPHPAKCFTERLKLTGARERIAKKTYIYATGWESHFTPSYEKAKADPSWRTVTVPCGHDVMLDMPDELIDLLLAAV
jgi:pimeloyl-ACP methyl ester carboxylesterase